jgi:hypothetical protein
MGLPRFALILSTTVHLPTTQTTTIYTRHLPALDGAVDEANGDKSGEEGEDNKNPNKYWEFA